MDSFEILSLRDSDKWNQYLKKFPHEQQDIYFTPEYFRLYENMGEGKAQCMVFEKDGNIAMYPFLINSINDIGYTLHKKFYDIQGVYGYNGILTNTNSSNFLPTFFYYFDEFCSKKNIIAEFSRINPLFKNPFSQRKNFEISHDRDNINVNLFNDFLFEKEYEYSTRKNIRKAIASGLSFKFVYGNEISELELESFHEIYNHTMKRNNTEEFYFFGIKYFKNLSSYLGNKALFVFVILDHLVISCEIVLLGANTAYSFLGGTLNDFFQYRPNDFLKHNTINLLKELGFENFLLGGGGEGVFRYKKSFSKNGVIPFFIGKKIHNQVIYDEIIKTWETKFPEKIEKYKNILLKYRY